MGDASDLSALRAGEIDWADSIPTQRVAQLKDDDSITLTTTPSNDYWYLATNQKREPFGVFDAYLFEANLALLARHAVYTRAEIATKSILGGGVHPPGFQHYHPHSRIGALTGGYVYDLLVTGFGRLGVGGDITGYRVPRNLQEGYGSMTGDLCSNQASASWAGVALCRWAASSSTEPGVASSPVASGNQGMNPMSLAVAYSRTASDCRLVRL